MAGSFNKILLIGNLGRDPELKVTPSGQTLARFSVATTEVWKDLQGEMQTRTEWHNIVVWGQQAEIVEKYLRKGKQVLIEGRIQYREYTDQVGVKKTACEIRCDNLLMLGRIEEGIEKSSEEKPSQSSDPYETPATPPPQPRDLGKFGDYEGIPG